MGEVYRARDTELHRDVAVKILPPAFSGDPDRLRRFRLEAQAAAALSHPNILSVFHVGLQDGWPYIVTELLEGETLRDRLRRGPMRLRESLEVCAAAAWGLAAAHEKGIVHRDIKPANVFITKDSRVKVLDFGLARLNRSLAPGADEPTALAEQTDAGLILGTVGYMSPEQVRGEAADSRTDIFALGTVLYEILTGRRAFDRPTPAETMSAIVNDDPPATSDVSQQMPAPVSRVVRRCLEKNAAKRFQSAEDLAFSLEGLVESGSSPSIVVVRKRSRRVLVIALVFGVLAVLAAGDYLRRKYSQTEPVPGARIDVQRLTETGTAYRASAVTPDGRYVAWVNSQKGVYELRLLQVASERDVVLLPESPLRISSLHFSPDGDYVYFLRQLSAEDPASFGVFRIAALGGPATPLATDVGTELSLTVSPDGKQIAYIAGPEPVIVSVDPNGQNRRIIAKRRREGESFWFLAWSRSPDRMAAVVGNDDGMSLVIVELPSGVVRDFPNISSWGALGQPAWSSDGARIFAPGSDLRSGGMMQVWSFDARSGAHLPLTASSVPFSQWTLSATANGALVANTSGADTTLWIADTSGQSHAVASIRGEGTDSLAWVDMRIVTANINRMIVHEPDLREPTPLRGTSSIYRHVSRCGAGQVAYWADTAERGSFIARTDLATGSTSALTDGPADVYPTCTPDGLTLVFMTCTAKSDRCLWMRKSLNSGQSFALYEIGGQDPEALWPNISPDGTQLLFFQLERRNPFQWARLVPMAGGNATTLTMPIPAGEVSGLRWAPDGKSMLVIRGNVNGIQNIWSVPTDGKPPKQITSFDSARIFAFDVAPDDRLAMSRGRRLSDVVMIKNVR